MNKHYEIRIAHDGSEVYSPFDQPDSIEGLNPEIVENTIAMHEFYASMSDDYSRMKSELAYWGAYRDKIGLPKK